MIPFINAIFTDIDGVYTSYASARKFGEYKTLDPECVARLQKIADAVDAKIVITSSRRIIRSLDEIRQSFRDAGLRAEIIGVTPRGEHSDPYDQIHDDIHSYLCDHWNAIRKTIGSGWDPSAPPEIGNWIVIDDASCAAAPGYLVLTKFETGLTDENVQEAIDLFKGPNVGEGYRPLGWTDEQINGDEYRQAIEGKDWKSCGTFDDGERRYLCDIQYQHFAFKSPKLYFRRPLTTNGKEQP